MAKLHLRNGYLEVKLNEDRTLAFATVYPAADGGEPVTVTQVRERLKEIGVTYGIRDRAIRDAIHYAELNGIAAINVVVAQGTVPEHGTDAHILYRLPADLLAQPLAKQPDGLPMPDWFALDRRNMVSQGAEIALLVPAETGSPGKTLTWPIHTVPQNPGKPANFRAGTNVETVDGTSFVAAAAGYASLTGDTLSVTALTILDEDLHDAFESHLALVLHGNAVKARIRSDSFVAISGAAVASQIRADGDILVSYAENCEIATPGSVYVVRGLKNCRVTSRGKLTVCPGGTLVGGELHVQSGVDAHEIGSPNATPTLLSTGVDAFYEVRNREIQAELVTCDENIRRISKALQPFTTHTSSTSLSETKRALLHRLQVQKRTLDLRMNQLHTERRHITVLRSERNPGIVTVAGRVWPGVKIEIGGSARSVDIATFGVRYQLAEDGTGVQTESLLEDAA